MKEFYKTNKVTYNLMSFTAFKALLIFSMLTESPKSFSEIAEKIENNQYLKEKISIDTMRVYINSLKRIGCEVKRTKGSDKVSKYYITKHPFELQLNDDQIQSIIKVYKALVKTMDIQDILYMDNLFEKIGTYISNQDFIDTMKNLSLLKGIDKKLLEELIDCCNKKNQIVIRYKSPNSGEKNIELITDKIEIKNNKIYLCGYGFEYKEYGIFLVNRIKNINEIKITKSDINLLKNIKIKYELTSINNNITPDENEKIIKVDGNKYTIEADTSNIFLLKQKLLEYGPTCKILEPEEFKNDFIKLLKEMKAGYCCD